VKAAACTAICLLGAVLAGCGVGVGSPRIVCEVNGEYVATGFTFSSFLKTLQREHGFVESSDRVFIRSRRVDIRFRELDKRRLVAERVTLLHTGKTMLPAVFFGIVHASSDAS
jgi:hypothetical protein